MEPNIFETTVRTMFNEALAFTEGPTFKLDPDRSLREQIDDSLSLSELFIKFTENVVTSIKMAVDDPYAFFESREHMLSGMSENEIVKFFAMLCEPNEHFDVPKMNNKFRNVVVTVNHNDGKEEYDIEYGSVPVDDLGLLYKSMVMARGEDKVSSMVIVVVG